MRTGSLAVLTSAWLLTGVAVASAQSGVPAPPPPAPAALSVPNPLAAMTPGPRDLYRSPDGSDRFQHLSQFPATPPVFFFPGPILYPGYPGAVAPWPYDYGYAATEYRPAIDAFNRRSMEAIVGRGGLILESVPPGAQVYVDGFYMGLAEEFGMQGRPLTLVPGPHRIELRASGFEPITFNVMIQRDAVVRFRGEMPAAPRISPPPAASAPGAQKNFYVIPNCYAGDRPPSGALPRGCDPKKLQTRP